MTRLLDRIDSPQDLHGLSDEELQQVAQEVREHIIDTVGEIGGHFGANLGTCELAVALHSVIESPRRTRSSGTSGTRPIRTRSSPAAAISSRRSASTRGLAPFCSIAESEHDIMGAGHASTSIGYAVGLKEGMRILGTPDAGKVVAVIGDGAMTGGVAFEAIHQAGGLGTPMVVVLNDNGMSIAPNVGALSRYFNRVRLNPKFWHAREGVEGTPDPAPRRHRRALREARPAAQGVDQGVLGARALLGGARLGVHGRHRRPRRRRAAPRPDAPRSPRSGPSSCTSRPSRARASRPPRTAASRAWRRWHAAKPKSIVDRAPAPKPAPVAADTAPAAPKPPTYTEVFGNAMVARDPARPARRRDHRGDEHRHRPGHRPEGRARALLRRRHRRAAGGPVRLRTRARGRQARLRDLLDLPAARVRPDRPRRRAAEPERRLRDGPRRARRRRRSDPPRRVRHRLPAAAAEHDADGPARRGDARDMLHTALRHDGPVGAALPARRGRRRPAAERAAGDRDRDRRDPA